MYENVILVPYRDRETHLKYFLDTLWPVIKICLTNVKLVIIEQVVGKSFNRGKLLNVGFKEYLDKTAYFITHDVDIIPSISILKHHYNVNEDIYIIYSAHGGSFGGITKFSNDAIKKNNGFPNNIWGWGIEDRAIYFRSQISQIGFKNSHLSRSEFVILPHESNAENYINEKKTISDMWRENYINTLNDADKKQLVVFSGINNIEYEILDRKELDANVELIKVNI